MSETEHERRQREYAERIMKAAMPSVEKVMQEITRQRSPLLETANVLAAQHQQMMTDLVRQISSSHMPAISAAAMQAAKIHVPALKLDYRSLFPNIAAIQASAMKSVMPAVEAIQALQRDQFAETISRVRAAVTASLPPNWRSDDVSVPRNLETLLLDEGLALAWVPPAAVVAKLFDPGTTAARRRIIGSRWKLITRACLEQLAGIEDAELAEHVEFAKVAAETLLTGNHQPAQALSANLLDTILRKAFDNDDRRSITGRQKRLDIDDYPLRVAIVLGGIWGSYGEFWTSQGDKVPREYSRHGSAHGVSRRQYSRINSLLALMHVVALLKLLETDLAVSNST